MTTLRESAFAKINLTLDVLGRRPDGYHDLCSFFQTISLADEITLILGTGEPWKVVCSRQDLPQDEGNLAWKAAALFCRRQGIDPGGLAIRIEKRIPSQAGLGGGSADGAAVLRALNRHYGSPYSPMALASLGAEIGSDVPFCVLGGAALAEGRGERLRPVEGLPDCTVALCKPDFSASTPELYRRLDKAQIAARPNQAAMEEALARGDLAAAGVHLCNVFTPVMAALHPELSAILEHFHRFGALGQEMTGSGSAVFALFPSETQAKDACAALKDKPWQTFVARPV